MAVVEADALAYLGVAVIVLREEGAEATPAAKVAPAELGGEGVDVFRLLHYGIIDADLVAGREELANDLFFLVGVKRRCHLFHDGCKLGLEGADCLADGINVPYEDTGIPIVIASGKVVLGGGEVGLLLEGFHLIYLVYVREVGCGDVTIACFWAAGLDANGHDGFFVGSIAQCLAQYSLILGGIDYQSIGWCHHDVGCRMLLLDLPTSISNTWSRIASLRLGENVVCRHVRYLLLDYANVFLVGDHPHVLNRTDWLQSIYCQLNEGTTDTHHINELLWVIVG